MKWVVREPSGKIAKENYEFTTSPWSFFETTESLFVLCYTVDDVIDPHEVKAKLHSVIEKIKTFTQKNGGTDISFRLYKRIVSKEDTFEPLPSEDPIETTLRLTTEENSSWYWDESLLVASTIGFSAIVQPESDGTEIGIYIRGEAGSALAAYIQAAE